jgi:hypothetical protein
MLIFFKTSSINFGSRITILSSSFFFADTAASHSSPTVNTVSEVLHRAIENISELEICSRESDAASSSSSILHTPHEGESKNKIHDTEKLICPCCGEMKALSHTFGPKITAIAIAACRDFVHTFKRHGIIMGEGGNSFRVCKLYWACALAIVEATRGKFLHASGIYRRIL